MITAIFPGTFDPFTIGHNALVRRALQLVDELYIAIGCFLVFNVVLGTAIEPIFNVIYQGLALL